MENGSGLLLISRISETKMRLPKKEQIIAEYVVAHLDEISSLSAKELAAITGTSLSSVVRFCQDCGFDGFADLKGHLERETLTTYQLENPHINQTDSAAIVKQKTLSIHQAIINGLNSIWDGSEFEAAVQAILNAKRIIVIGEGGSRSTALTMFYIFTQMQLPLENYNDPVFEIMKVSTLVPGDVVVGISYTGRLKNTIDSLNVAKERGATTIGLIGSPDSPILEYVDIVIQTTSVEKRYYESALGRRVSELAVVEVLYSLLAARIDVPVEGGNQSGYLNRYIDMRRVKERV